MPTTNRLRKNLTATILIPSAVMALIIALLLWQFTRQISEADRVEHTDQVMLTAESARAQFLGAQKSLRDYFITSAPADRDAVGQQWNQGQSIIKQLLEMVSDNPAEEQRLEALNGLERQWMGAAEQALLASANGQGIPILQTMNTLGKQVIAKFDEISAAEQKLRIERDARRDAQTRIVLWGTPIGVLLLATLLTYIAWVEIKDASVRFADALKAAEDANQAKTNFLATVSHELRNPLNSILLWCNALLSSGKLEGRVEQGVNAISRSAKAQAQLIEDLLDVSRIETGRMRLDVQPADLPEVVKAAVESMTPAADAKSITMQLIIDPRAGIVMGDPLRLQQAVWNLLSNAVKFTHNRGKIQVRLERINSHLEVSVSDNGPGMDRDTLARVFERFWQGTDRSGTEKGLGLGMSIVKHIAGLHGGTVTAHSDGLGKGSSFILRLPLPVTSAGLALAERRHPTASPPTQIARGPRLDGISLLVVDDDLDARDALKSLLTALGANVRAAETVEAALDALAQRRPDVLISDLGMPGRDGYSLIREIRSGEKATNSSERLAVVALTAYGRVADKVEIFSSGFDSHVVKPVDAAELAAVIRSLVESRRGDSNTPEQS
ncbi:MAG TPA: ATP-binding protein [Candidatus Binataceae bacterium]